MNLKYLTFLLTLVFLASCTEDEELLNLDQYIVENNLEVQTTDSGLRYIIDFPGNGEMPTIEDEVRVRYKGFTTDGEVFDHNLVDGVTSPLTNFIPGWIEGIQLFGKGGTGRLFIPSFLGYGSNPPEGIGIRSNADLIFEIELVNF